MSREVHVRFREGAGVRFPRATRLLFDLRGKAFVSQIKLKRIAATVHVVALVALLTGLSLAALDDLVAVTMGTEYGDK